VAPKNYNINIFLDAKPGGKYNDHWAVNGLMVNWSNEVQCVFYVRRYKRDDVRNFI